MSSFDPHRIQYLAIAGSLALLLFIVELIRRQRLRENYSLLWLAVCTLFLVVSLWRDGLELLARLFGIAYPPSALLLMMVIGIFLILIQFSIITSDLTNKVRRMAQEVGLLRQRLEELERDERRHG
ncbi:MAG TPA: DUF2304 domain-containing protein [Candidatus Edwardsbacteria bacterium]|nr:DUF2304 domain-containing protein [Candidatus Edwardsbacteria bacterium]